MKYNNYHTLIKEIASTYELSTEFVDIVVQNELKTKISAYLQYPVVLSFNPDLTITGFPSIKGAATEIDIPPSRIRGVLKTMLKDIEGTLHLYKAKQDLVKYDYLRGTLLHGKVVQITKTHSLIVSIPDVPLIAICPSGKLINKEMGKLSVGNELYFYVNRIVVDEDYYSNTRAMIVLSRVSIELPRLLLSKFIFDSWDIACVRRLPGIRSLLHSQYPVPKQLLYQTSEALCGEFIKVRYDR